jgi:SAM-dependent methyltransferase
MTVDIVRFNKRAWDRQVQQGNRWTVPVSPEETARARRGDWHVLLTPTKPVPTSWFPPLSGLDLLCLASGGGQQGPIFAAAGANVTVFDNSPGQLAQDRMVAGRDSLDIQTVEGDMVDLSCFPDNCFDLIFHPVSNTFIPAVRPVWQEAYRVLRSGGALLAGFNNPVIYIFDFALYEEGVLQAKYALPYSDLTSLSEEEKERFLHEDAPLEFGHLLEDQIGGQIDAGFVIVGFYEDADPSEILSRHLPGFIATRAIKQ